MAIRHIVILNFKKNDQVNFLDLMEPTRPLIENMEGISGYHIYKNESHYTPREISSIGIQIDFDSETALESFMNNPKHYEANKLFEGYLADPPFSVLTHHI